MGEKGHQKNLDQLHISPSSLSECISKYFYSILKSHLQNRPARGKAGLPAGKGGMGAACVWEACVHQCCRHCFLGARNAHSVLSQGRKGNRQQQKEGSLFTLSFLAADKTSSFRLRLQDVCSLPEVWNSAPLRWSMTAGLAHWSQRAWQKRTLQDQICCSWASESSSASPAHRGAIKLLSSFEHRELSHDYLTCGLPLPATPHWLGICQLLWQGRLAAGTVGLFISDQTSAGVKLLLKTYCAHYAWVSLHWKVWSLVV